MSTNLLRNTILFLGALALTCMVIVAYGSYKTTTVDTADACCLDNNTPSTEMPWETLSTSLIGAVSF